MTGAGARSNPSRSSDHAGAGFTLFGVTGLLDRFEGLAEQAGEKDIRLTLHVHPGDLAVNAEQVTGVRADRELPVGELFKGVVPFVIFDLITIIILLIFPAICTWLPENMM